MDRINLSFAVTLTVSAFLAAPAAHGTILVPRHPARRPTRFSYHLAQR
jgi:hypothetical protein